MSRDTSSLDSWMNTPASSATLMICSATSPRPLATTLGAGRRSHRSGPPPAAADGAAGRRSWRFLGYGQRGQRRAGRLHRLLQLAGVGAQGVGGVAVVGLHLDMHLAADQRHRRRHRAQHREEEAHAAAPDLFGFAVGAIALVLAALALVAADFPLHLL